MTKRDDRRLLDDRGTPLENQPLLVKVFSWAWVGLWGFGAIIGMIVVFGWVIYVIVREIAT